MYVNQLSYIHVHAHFTSKVRINISKNKKKLIADSLTNGNVSVICKSYNNI